MGTHDVSLLSIEDGVFEVKSTAGNCHLGGSDLDNRIVDYCVREFKNKQKVDLSDNKRALRRIRNMAERAKRTLSSQSNTTIEVEAIHDGMDLIVPLSRAKFESLCLDIFQQTIQPVERVLQDAKISKGQIDDIVLVGGSTRIPKIQQLLSDFFGGKELCKNINPDEAVAYGAAVQAAILSGKRDEKIDQLVLLDVTPLSLGVETAGGIMTNIIPRGTVVPTKKTQTFSTASNNQPAVTIQVFEGERKMTRDNNKLGEFHLRGIPPMPRGQPQIEITYEVDANGILQVSAVEKSTGKAEKITITNESSRLSKQDIERMVAEAEKYKEQDTKIQERIESRNNLENYCYNVRSSVLENDKLKQSLGSDYETIDKLVNETIEWLENNNEANTEEYKEKQHNLEQVFNTIMARVYQQQEPTTQSNTEPNIQEVD